MNTISIKIGINVKGCGKETRRFTIDRNQSFEDFKKLLKSLVSDVDFQDKSFQIAYMDEEGDWIMVGTEMEWRHALDSVGAQGATTLRMRAGTKRVEKKQKCPITSLVSFPADGSSGADYQKEATKFIKKCKKSCESGAFKKSMQGFLNELKESFRDFAVEWDNFTQHKTSSSGNTNTNTEGNKPEDKGKQAASMQVPKEQTDDGTKDDQTKQKEQFFPSAPQSELIESGANNLNLYQSSTDDIYPPLSVENEQSGSSQNVLQDTIPLIENQNKDNVQNAEYSQTVGEVKSPATPAPQQPFANELYLLRDMGFRNEKLNEQLLKQFKGALDEVVQKLLNLTSL